MNAKVHKNYLRISIETSNGTNICRVDDSLFSILSQIKFYESDVE